MAIYSITIFHNFSYPLSIIFSQLVCMSMGDNLCLTVTAWMARKLDKEFDNDMKNNNNNKMSLMRAKERERKGETSPQVWCTALITEFVPLTPLFSTLKT